MISRKSLTAIAATTLVLSLGSTAASFAATATPAPKKPAVSGGVTGTEGTVGHEKGEGAKVKANGKSRKVASAALTAWRRGHLDAKRVEKADLLAAVTAFKSEKLAADKSTTKTADLAVAKTKFLAAKAAAKAKFDAAIAALGTKPVK